jgi:hypothetical protein
VAAIGVTLARVAGRIVAEQMKVVVDRAAVARAAVAKAAVPGGTAAPIIAGLAHTEVIGDLRWRPSNRAPPPPRAAKRVTLAFQARELPSEGVSKVEIPRPFWVGERSVHPMLPGAPRTASSASSRSKSR